MTYFDPINSKISSILGDNREASANLGQAVGICKYTGFLAFAQERYRRQNKK
jgi:hypothetical protein